MPEGLDSGPTDQAAAKKPAEARGFERARSRGYDKPSAAKETAKKARVNKLDSNMAPAQGNLRLVQSNCPKCGFRLPANGAVQDECPACGIVMSKWLDATEGSQPRLEPLRRSNPGRTPSTLIGAIPLVCMLGFSYWLWTEMPQPFSTDARVVVNHKERVTRASEKKAEASTTSNDDAGTAGNNESSGGQPEPVAAKNETAAQPRPTEAPGRFGTAEEAQEAAAAEAAAAEAEAESAQAAQAAEAAQVPPEGHCPVDWKPPERDGSRPAQLPDWYHDHSGYIAALRRRSHVSRAMLLYFRTESCPWARRFEEDFLGHRPIANWASTQIRVVVDAQGGADEAELVRKLKIVGFPAFVVIPESPGPPVHIAPYPSGKALDRKDFLEQLKLAAR